MANVSAAFKMINMKWTDPRIEIYRDPFWAVKKISPDPGIIKGGK
jgi:hypothetical protein